MTTLGWLGVALLVAGAVAILVELAVAALWTRRVAARARLLSERLEGERRLIETDIARLRGLVEETRVLWQPYERLLRYARHPLIAAFIQSLLKRRKASARA